MTTLQSISHGTSAAWPAQPFNGIAPVFAADTVSEAVETLLGKVMLDFEAKSGNRGKFPPSFGDNTTDNNPDLYARRQQILDLLKSGPLSAETIAGRTQIGRNFVAADLAVFQTNGLVTRSRSKQASLWTITQKGRDYTPPEFDPSATPNARRKRVLELLADGPMAFSDIALAIGVTKNSASTTIYSLRTAGLITPTRGSRPGARFWQLVEGED